MKENMALEDEEVEEGYILLLWLADVDEPRLVYCSSQCRSNLLVS